MHALMGKGHKSPTPQELYRARKQEEEEERNAFLPPGLVNHGNTCFMNSVLQGLMATPMLVDIVRFTLPETYAPLASRKSPQLTNGHGLGGNAERGWEKGMPLGDSFVQFMETAWKMQDERRRQSMSPRDLLTGIGTKFDQYLDFRQQDAHEFLRHLLDAMRMEELDIIKQRQPPPPKPDRRRGIKGQETRSSPKSATDIHEEDRLVSFVDMVFGGRLASILVCEECKKVSYTYEDFNDLSLSIKQEDYEKSRKRDRLKTIARKLGMRGRSAARELDIPEGPRSSSVPSSPLRRSEEAHKSFELILDDVGQRRRSLEAGEETPSLTRGFRDPLDSTDTSTEQAKQEDQLLSISGEIDQQKDDSKQDKDEDNWVKLRRKISVGVGMRKGHRKKHGKKENPPGLPSNDDSQVEAATGDEASEAFVDVKAPLPIPVSLNASPLLGASKSLQKLPFVQRPSSHADVNSPDPSTVPTPSQSPDVQSISLPETRPSSPAPSTSEHARPKYTRPRPLKRSRSESAYLRRLLADVPSGPSSTASVPFNLFRISASASSPDMSDARGAWPKLGHVQSLEGCLKLFTSVEVLDGENMVGCRRCWKIKHGDCGSRERRAQRDVEGDEEDEEEEDETGSSSSASVKIGLLDSGGLRPQDAGSMSPISELSNSVSLSIHSAPPSSLRKDLSSDSQVISCMDAGTSSSPTLPIPFISMTAPEPNASTSKQTPTAEGHRHMPAPVESSVRLVSSPSRDSLRLPTTTRHVRQPAERLVSLSDASSLSSEESATEEEETETSFSASNRSDTSSIASTHLEPSGLSSTIRATNRATALTTNSNGKSESRRDQGKGKGLPRSKQVIMRRAYKRYLIATPPPVLVVHFKRFQQVGRGPTQLQFFTNFKKLDDPVSFPEYLNLRPYLLPSKDDLKGNDEKKKGKEDKESGIEACMYRLCAVIVHIGNMLGGHYVAYSALPDSSPPPAAAGDEEKVSSSISASSTQTSPDIKPEIPRTASFSRTANIHAHSSSKPRSSSSTASNASTQRQWCYVSDTVVRLATLEEVLQAKAYMCMYERVWN